MSTKKKTPLRIVAAIDVGTTHSSMAWAASTNPDQIAVIKSWGDGAATGPNVPTRLQYRKGVAKGRKHNRWGLQAEPENSDLGTVYEWFKLQLYPSLKDDELEKEYPFHKKKPSKDEVRQLMVDYLAAMRANFEALIPILNSGVTIGQTPIEYILTVPSIWTDPNKAMVEACAIDAGLGFKHGTIEMMLEPEAAGLHALQSGIDLKIEVGQTFVLCDAGGATVDLMSFNVASLDTHSLVEAAPPLSGLCGSTFINRAFEAWLDENFQGVEAFDRTVKSQVMKKFEEKIKRHYKGLKGEPYKCQVKGVLDNAALGVKKGWLTIPGDKLRKIFKKVTEKVVELVLHQISVTTPAQVTTVVLTGGFGANEYLKIEVERALSRAKLDISVKHVIDSDTAVARGVLLSAMHRADSNVPTARIESKTAVNSYGIAKYVPFDKSKHDRSKREWNPREQVYRVQVIDWFLAHRNRCDEKKPKCIKLSWRKASDGKPLAAILIVVYMHEGSQKSSPPKHPSRDVKQILEVTAQLNLIPIKKLHTSTGCNDEEYVRADFDLEAILDAENLLRLEIKHKGKLYGAAAVKVASPKSP